MRKLQKSLPALFFTSCLIAFISSCSSGSKSTSQTTANQNVKSDSNSRKVSSVPISEVFSFFEKVDALCTHLPKSKVNRVFLEEFNAEAKALKLNEASNLDEAFEQSSKLSREHRLKILARLGQSTQFLEKFSLQAKQLTFITEEIEKAFASPILLKAGSTEAVAASSFSRIEYQPKWMQDYVEKSKSGKLQQFIVTGNTEEYSVIRNAQNKAEFIPVEDYFSRKFAFQKRDVVLEYSPSGGLRLDQKSWENKNIRDIFNKVKNDYDSKHHTNTKNSNVKDPKIALEIADQFLKNVMKEDALGQGVKIRSAFKINQSEILFPGTGSATQSELASFTTDLLSKWRSNTEFGNGRLRVFLFSSEKGKLPEAIQGSTSLASVDISLPNATERKEFIEKLLTADKDLENFVLVDRNQLVNLTDGTGLKQIENLLAKAKANRIELDDVALAREAAADIEKNLENMVEVEGFTKGSIRNSSASKKVQDYMIDLCEKMKKGNIPESFPIALGLPGPSGVGKTHFTRMMAAECGVPFFSLKEFKSMMHGEDTRKLSKLFEFLKSRKAILFIDEVDTVIPKGGTVNAGYSDQDILRIFLKNLSDPKLKGKLLVVGASSRWSKLNPDIRSRFSTLPFTYPKTVSAKRLQLQSILESKKVKGITADQFSDDFFKSLQSRSPRDYEQFIDDAMTEADLAGRSVTREMIENSGKGYTPGTSDAEAFEQEITAIFSTKNDRLLPDEWLKLKQQDEAVYKQLKQAHDEGMLTQLEVDAAFKKANIVIDP